ncbi:mutator type transposase, partial [Tanacetum coccineum]
MYRFKVSPVDGPDMWPKSNLSGILTPQPGRPKKKRRKSAFEFADAMEKGGKLTRKGKSVTCTKCGQVAFEFADAMAKGGKLTRKGKSVTCIKCGQVGHTQRSCKDQRSTNVRSHPTSHTTKKFAKKPASSSQTQTGSQAAN